MPRRPRPTTAVLALALSLLVALLAGCGSDGGSAGGGSEGVDGGGGIATAIVADSEIPEEVADLVAGAEGLDVRTASSEDGATMAELDPLVDAALADDPQVLVYAGGTNDLPAGPTVMLAGLEERLARYAAETCVVVAVPIFRFRGTTDEEIAAETAGTRVLEEAVAEAGAQPVSYLNLALAMRADGEDFFAEGELGDLHPGTVAYPRIAEALAAAVRSCE
jgi:hypothetical protein